MLWLAKGLNVSYTPKRCSSHRGWFQVPGPQEKRPRQKLSQFGGSTLTFFQAGHFKHVVGTICGSLRFQAFYAGPLWGGVWDHLVVDEKAITMAYWSCIMVYYWLYIHILYQRFNLAYTDIPIYRYAIYKNIAIRSWKIDNQTSSLNRYFLSA